MIIKKFTYREVRRALGLELMKLRWDYCVKLKQAAHLSGIDLKKIDAAEIGRGVGAKISVACWICMMQILKLNLSAAILKKYP